MNLSCPRCGSCNIRKNGHRGKKQNYQCKDCQRQFVEFYSEVGYSKEFKEECLKMYLNGLGFRAIEKIKKVNHNTVIRWVKEAANQFYEANNQDPPPEVVQLDEIQTFIGKKTNKIWIWTSVNKFEPNILAYTIGDRSAKTFEKLWTEIKEWNCYFWVTDN